ncbi:hypothetical protein [Halodurantibacterium flavum]|uniref:Uncharacterized protein n=1 Tax=Halodurantibacterium flavum TaxID=1382802 RepID=A0ABW4S8B9_9RHOB
MPTLSGGITLGNLLNLGAIAASLIAGYVALQINQGHMLTEQARIERDARAALEGMRATHERQITDIRADIVNHRQSIQRLEVNEARASERYDALARSLEELKAAQRETNQMLRQIAQQGGGG